ncbi:hypothetical protein FACS189419_04910 [Planctomycetales bacterium]|nr:hypothetical protein FACS189419_04910 [Planctomycetales bacterium]
MSNELTLIVNDELLLKEITFNYSELKTALDERLEYYRALTVSENGIAEAKQDRAKLNKLESALKDKQLEISRKLLGGFDGKVKELRAMISDASRKIDEQVKYFERLVKDDKKAAIEKYYGENIGGLAGLIPFDRLYESRYENKGCALKDACFDIKTKIDKALQDLTVIDALQVPENIAVSVKDYFLRTLDLSAALREKSRLEAAAAALAKRAEEEKRKQDTASVVETKQEELRAKGWTEDEIPDFGVKQQSAETEEPLQQLDFRVWVNAEQKAALKSFLVANKIKYGKVH